MSPTRIPAAGTLPWRATDGSLEVALVHRPRYDDWSWAKGKLDPGEEWPVAAGRETEEETGLVVRLGPPLPESRYVVLDRGDDSAARANQVQADLALGRAAAQVRQWDGDDSGCGNGGGRHEGHPVQSRSSREANPSMSASVFADADPASVSPIELMTRRAAGSGASITALCRTPSGFAPSGPGNRLLLIARMYGSPCGRGTSVTK